MFGVYLHWPFCESKCPYCDFNSHVADTVDHAAFADALCREMDHFKDQCDPQTVTSVFFGGGTPSLMKPASVEKVINHIHKNFSVAPDAEITLEANPGSIERDKFSSFRAAGVNRVSIGVQSLDDAQLKFLGRKHSAADALQAIDTARNIFPRFSFDLIYARPGQTLLQWESELQIALRHAGDHLSLYQLTIEQGTPFFGAHKNGAFVMPEDHLQADLYDLTSQIMNDAGMPAYEISNYAKPEQECRHNLTYWRYDDYLGIGAGAHGRITKLGRKFATRTHRAPAIWLDRVQKNGHATQDFIELDAHEQFEERLLMGLRLTEGLPIAPLKNFISLPEVERLITHGFLQANATHLIATGKGRLCLNAVLQRLILADHAHGQGADDMAGPVEREHAVNA